MKDFLSKDTLKILEKYDNAKPIEVMNGIEMCAITKADLEFLLGYTEGSLAIERDLKDKVKKLTRQVSDLVWAIRDNANEDEALMKLAERIESE